MKKDILDQADWIYTKVYSELIESGFPMVAEVDDEKYESYVVSAEEIANLSRIKYLLKNGVTDPDMLFGRGELHSLSTKSSGLCMLVGSYSWMSPASERIWLEDISLNVILGCLNGISAGYATTAYERFLAKRKITDQHFRPDWENGEGCMEELCSA